MRFNKVFGIGLPRTGTTSLNMALNELDISSVHFPFSLYETDDLSILNQYTGFVDTPIPMLYQKLDKLCPNSGFILTTRPIEGWLKSMEWLLREGRYIWEWKSSYDDFNQTFFGASNFDIELYQSRYYAFHTEVFDYFQDQENLLILDLNLGYGYEELCKFLDVPVLPTEYPRGNESRPARFLQKLAYKSGQYNKSWEKLIRRCDYYLQRTQNRFKLL
ncbi:MAG: sulfotransferase family protein [Dolichospermum sp.]